MCSRVCTSVSEDIDSFYELSVYPLQSTSGVEVNTVNDIGMCLTEFLNIQDEQKLAPSFISHNSNSGVENEDPQHFDKCLTKSATFPRPDKLKYSAASMGCENEGETEVDGLIAEVLTENATGAKSVNQHYARPKSLPAPLKLVSALKGSREKQGTPLKKLSVTWAPDVYDPLPTAVWHVVTSQSQRHHHHYHHHHHRSSNSKKHTRSKQKGSSSKTSRGSMSSSSKGKDKKQQAHRAAYRGGGSSSSRCLKSLEEEERAGGGDFYESGDAVDFDVGSSPDPYCGSSFLKKTVTKLHFSVAEAT